MDKLSLQDPLFATYTIAATLMILKAVAMSWLTVVRMMRVKGGFRSPEDLREDAAQLRTPIQSRLEPDDAGRADPAHSPERPGEPALLPGGRLSLCAHRTAADAGAGASVRLRGVAAAALRRVPERAHARHAGDAVDDRVADPCVHGRADAGGGAGVLIRRGHREGPRRFARGPGCGVAARGASGRDGGIRSHSLRSRDPGRACRPDPSNPSRTGRRACARPRQTTTPADAGVVVWRRRSPSLTSNHAGFRAAPPGAPQIPCEIPHLFERWRTCCAGASYRTRALARALLRCAIFDHSPTIAHLLPAGHPKRSGDTGDRPLNRPQSQCRRGFRRPPTPRGTSPPVGGHAPGERIGPPNRQARALARASGRLARLSESADPVPRILGGSDFGAYRRENAVSLRRSIPPPSGRSTAAGQLLRHLVGHQVLEGPAGGIGAHDKPSCALASRAYHRVFVVT